MPEQREQKGYADARARETITTSLRARLDPKQKRRELWDRVCAVLTADGTVSKGMRQQWLDHCMLWEPTSGNYLLLAVTREQMRQVDMRWRTQIRLELDKMIRARTTLALDFGAPALAQQQRGMSA
jgi:hypothetical protein